MIIRDTRVIIGSIGSPSYVEPCCNVLYELAVDVTEYKPTISGFISQTSFDRLSDRYSPPGVYR